MSLERLLRLPAQPLSIPMPSRNPAPFLHTLSPSGGRGRGAGGLNTCSKDLIRPI